MTRQLPDALKLVKGTAQRCRMNPDQPEYDTLMECPRGFDKKHKAAWFEIVPMLIDAGVATVADVHALEMLIEKKIQWRKAQDKVNEMGDVIESPSGYPILNPYYTTSMQLGKEYGKLLSDFGMTPSSRQKVIVDTPPKNSGRFADVKRK